MFKRRKQFEREMRAEIKYLNRYIKSVDESARVRSTPAVQTGVVYDADGAAIGIIKYNGRTVWQSEPICHFDYKPTMQYANPKAEAQARADQQVAAAMRWLFQDDIVVEYQ